jgi:CheY-like chemotaxis protein
MARPRILLVEDHALNAELARYVLEEDDCEVKVAADAVQAQACLAGWLPDLVLTDVQLPGIDGLELTQLLRKEPRMQGVVFVAFTAHAMKGDGAKFIAAGCDGYLSKPIDVGTFARSVRGFLPR